MKYRKKDIWNMVMRLVAILLVLILFLAGAGYLLAPKAKDLIHEYQEKKESAAESKKLAEESARAASESEEAVRAAEEASRAEQSRIDASKAAEEASRQAELALHDYNMDTGAYVNGSYMTFGTHHYTCYRSTDTGDKNASEYCKTQGRHLLEIDSEDEKRSVEDFLKYMGYSSSFSNGVTSDGYIICEWDN